jgi:DNA-binding SARP family transcriptional activator
MGDANDPVTEPLSADRLLDALPYGVVAVDSGGHVLRANATARELLPALDTDAGRARCSDLLGCCGPGKPCEHGCLAARSNEAAQTLPEVRIETPGLASVSALWVTAAPLSHCDGALLHLRPGDARDRRRRSEPHWMSGPKLRITSLGRTVVESDAGPLAGHWLRERPGQLLKYLVCQRAHVATADQIAEALWPSGGRQGLLNARHVVHRLRELLEPRREGHGQSSFVVAVRGGYILDRRHLWLDVDEFERLVEQGLAAAEQGQQVAGRGDLEKAVELYRGDFLADEPYADWCHDERNRLCLVAARAVRALAGIARGAGDQVALIVQLERLCGLEPFDSQAHRELIEALRAAGRRTEARRHYTTFAHRVRREFDEEPGFDLKSPS